MSNTSIANVVSIVEFLSYMETHQLLAHATGEGCKDTHQHKKLSKARFELTDLVATLQFPMILYFPELDEEGMMGNKDAQKMRNRAITFKIYLNTGEKITVVAAEKYITRVVEKLERGMKAYKLLVRENIFPDFTEDETLMPLIPFMRKIPVHKNSEGEVIGPSGRVEIVSTDEIAKLSAMLEAAAAEFGNDPILRRMTRFVQTTFIVKGEQYPPNPTGPDGEWVKMEWAAGWTKEEHPVL